MTNRSIRTIRSELAYLADNHTITPDQLNSILNQLPKENIRTGTTPAISPPPTNSFSNLSVNPISEKSTGYYNQDTSVSGVAPPAYPGPNSASGPPPPASSAPILPALTHATALYAYTPTDSGDLAIQANDRIAVTEYMNADWWKGRNERTGVEGIFPRSYVQVIEEKGGPSIAPGSGQPNHSNNYGNMPLDVSQQGNGEGKAPNKGQEMGKKFGKKMGNAAIFGAGATIGSNIVNGIF
ncbi:SH3-domain-containing protein [Eremomyces bilateralis CBS 781.70]|uniref:SH3-domain-containing protein n=1 Tax=Eremomyces bilateralis CBS 781.70 TaxID=1392243 RepID=A0A6G1FVC0_9PEZI|nr:SH3-domain-containing protein [Eremomyces bilateralis CBS 781.70]KAF1809656.1 SH3-domain-containing protein [Eremomyces bilateralis CBS 781.70]